MGVELIVGQTNQEIVEVHPTAPSPPGPVGPQGPKGDPGGWASASGIANDVDLNTLTTPGVYFRGSSVGSTIALNYPQDSWAGWVEVVAYGASIMQRATSIYSNPGVSATARNMWVRTKSGSTWQSWMRIDTPSYGTGFPEGVVTAAVGSRYIDTAATNGAIEWIKASGAGNTGWKVTYGDTGWRNVTSKVSWNESAVNVSDPSLSLAIRRIGSECMLRVSGRAPGTTVTNQQIFTGLPSGWEPDSNGAYVGAVFNTSNNQDVHGLATLLLSGITVGRILSNSLFRIYIRYETSSQWPSVLP